MASNRKLSLKEAKRKEQFDAMCDMLVKDGYTKKDLTVSAAAANFWAIILMLPFAAVIFSLYFYFHATGFFGFTNSSMLLFVLLFLVCIVIHEGIHGFTWGMFAKNRFHSIDFGIIWRYLTPYCTCAEPLKKSQYIIGAAMPTLILGFALAAIAICMGLPRLALLSVMMLFAGGGDFLIIVKILLHRTSKKTVLCCDHPYECGLVVFEKSGCRR